MSSRSMWWIGAVFTLASIMLFKTQTTYADPPLQSSNYQFEESTVGAGGLIDSSSSNYTGSSSTGDLVVGNTSSGNYQIDTGSQTTKDPALSFIIVNANANFGSFSTTLTSTATTSFSVSNYTSYGYVVQMIGNPPTDGAHTIAPMTANDTSHIGTEQFGINLTANTSPASFGSIPDNGQFGFGEVSTNYSTANNFRYVSGETIAFAPKSSGVTIYTVSYIVNVNSLTPGGQYNSSQTIIITGTY